MVEAYLLILAKGAETPSITIGALPILSDVEQKRVLALGREASRDWPRDTLLHEWLSAQARVSRPSSVFPMNRKTSMGQRMMRGPHPS